MGVVGVVNRYMHVCVPGSSPLSPCIADAEHAAVFESLLEHEWQTHSLSLPHREQTRVSVFLDTHGFPSIYIHTLPQFSKAWSYSSSSFLPPFFPSPLLPPPSPQTPLSGSNFKEFVRILADMRQGRVDGVKVRLDRLQVLIPSAFVERLDYSHEEDLNQEMLRTLL